MKSKSTIRKAIKGLKKRLKAEELEFQLYGKDELLESLGDLRNEIEILKWVLE